MAWIAIIPFLRSQFGPRALQGPGEGPASPGAGPSEGQAQQGGLISYPSLLAVLAYVALLAAAESLTSFVDPRLGVGLHVALLAALLVHASMAHGGEVRSSMLLALALGPIVRLGSITMPLGELPRPYWTLAASAPMVSAAFFVARWARLSRRELGLDVKAITWQAGVAAAGFLLGAMEYAILKPEPLLDHARWQDLALVSFIVAASTGLAEEFSFRGVMQPVLVRGMGAWGVPLGALVFAVLHIGYRSVADFLFVLAVGLFFGWVVYRTGSILGVTLSHALTNITLFLLLPSVIIPASPDLQALFGVQGPPQVMVTFTHEAPPPSPTHTRPVAGQASPEEPALATPAASATPLPGSTPSSGQLSPSPTPTPTPAASTPSPTPSFLRHVVQPGETLTAIALRYGVSVDELVRVNGIRDPDIIPAGAVLLVPVGPR